MKKIICIMAMVFVSVGLPSFAGPTGNHGGPRGGAIHAGVSVGHRPVAGRPPVGGMHRPPMHTHVGVRPLPPPPLYRPYRPIYRPYYSYYPTTTYYTTTYYPATSYNVVEPIPATTETVVVRDGYAGLNTTLNVINTISNVASTIRYLTW